jgi:two-component system, response regulator
MFPSLPNILYAEDNEDDFVLLKYAMTQAQTPAQLVFVSSGQAALEYLRQHPPPAIILLDRKLPGLSGLDVLEWLRAERPDITCPVILLTSANREADEQRALALGAQMFLEKPGNLAGYVAFARELTTLLRLRYTRS